MKNKAPYINIKLIPLEVIRVLQVLLDGGGQGWLVGGSARDLLLGLAPSDWDIEVYGLSPDKLEPLLSKLGQCEYLGKHFGVYKLWMIGADGVETRLEIDVALPRTEVKSGLGHVGFLIQSDPYIAPEQATLRRDFTINAMMYDPIHGHWLDFHGGELDLQAKLLRHVSPAFAEDPLRPLRAMQFAARFGLHLDQQTSALCAQLLPESLALPVARIWQEWKKWARAPYPSLGLVALSDMGWLLNYPALRALVGCPQDATWHPEGDVWTHTMLVLDAMAYICRREQCSADERLILMLAALTHDLGKPETTRVNADGSVSCRGHENAGLSVAHEFLLSLGCPKKNIVCVLPVVAQHIRHFTEQALKTNVRHLADTLFPANIYLWEMLTEADASGCAPLPATRPALVWRQIAAEQDCLRSKVAPIVTGKMLLLRGVQPSPDMGLLLQQAYMAQMDGDITDERSANLWLQKTRLQEQM